MTTSKSRLKALKEQKQRIKDSSGGNNHFFFIKADDTIRCRILPVDENQPFGVEILQYYLGQEIKGVISPMTFEEPCAITELRDELLASDDEGDQKLADKLKPRIRFVVPVIKYKDLKGKEIDVQSGVRMLLLTKGQYDDLVDFYLDEDELGDFTDPDEGYDIKFSRTGSGMTDTEYKQTTCRPTTLHKDFDKIYDLEELLREAMPTYEETETYINRFMGIKDEEDEPREPKKKKSTKTSTKTATKTSGRKKVLRRRKKA